MAYRDEVAVSGLSAGWIEEDRDQGRPAGGDDEPTSVGGLKRRDEGSQPRLVLQLRKHGAVRSVNEPEREASGGVGQLRDLAG